MMFSFELRLVVFAQDGTQLFLDIPRGGKNRKGPPGQYFRDIITLLAPQRAYGIEPGGAPCRHQAGDGGDGEKCRRHRCEG